jgi:hypothetical protein
VGGSRTILGVALVGRNLDGRTGMAIGVCVVGMDNVCTFNKGPLSSATTLSYLQATHAHVNTGNSRSRKTNTHF